jgi:hypothetical protein
MDPLSAISLASSIIQIVDFGSRLTRDAIATYKAASGTTVSNESKEFMALDLDHVLSRLATSIQPQGIPFVLQEHDQRLEDLRQRCEALAQKLLTKLKTFKRKKDDGKWKSIVKALRGTFSEAEIDSIDKRIADIRQEIGLHILVVLKYVKPVRSRSKVIRCRAF